MAAVSRTLFATRFDFRAPDSTPRDRQALFARALEQVEYAESTGHDVVMLSEHHGSKDGYLPSPLPVAAAFAARTRTIPITVSALIVNLYDPVRLAEDIAVIDLLSGGRVSYVFALGYRTEEYALYRRPWTSRGQDTENALELVLEALRTQRVDRAGRVGVVTPAPLSRPHPIAYYGGGTPTAARRAARLGLNFQPQIADEALRDLYRAECERLGRRPGHVMMPPPGPATVFCAADPDEFWARYGDHLLADARGYAAWHQSGTALSHVFDRSTTTEELRAAGTYLVDTPDGLIRRCREGILPVVTTHPLCAGMPEDPSWESMRLLGEKVVPALREDRKVITENRSAG